MVRKLKIELEDDEFHNLNDICDGDESVMQDYIAQTLKEKLNQGNCKFSSEEKINLESYLKKGHSGKRKYGVKGQGW